jgi:tetratricopeptide (TPR) repeat protein
VHSEDVETLWKLLPASGGALATAVPHDGLLHPSLADAEALGRRLRILGGPGSGKSFFVFQLLKQLPPSLVLVLRSLNRDEVMAPIRDIAAWAELPLVILVDNLHRSLTPTASCDAFPLLLNISAAARCLRQALEHQELLGSITRPNIFLALGRIALLEGEGEEATRWFDEARSHGVPALNILRLRVAVHEKRGDLLAAIAELEEYLHGHDAEAQDWTALGRFLSRTGRHPDSAEAMRRACELEPHDAENFLALGVELFLAGESAQALPHLEAGVKLGPQDPRGAALLLVDCLIDLHRPADLLQRARRFLHREPSPPSEVPDEPAWIQEPDPHWATLASLLRFLVRSEWPPLSKRALRARKSR